MAYARLHHDETIQIDRVCLAKLVEAHGEQGAERLVGKTLDGVAVRLGQIERGWHAGDLKRMHLALRDLEGLARRIGLTATADISNDVMMCLARADTAAAAATVARLVRVSESSLSQFWDFRMDKL